MTDTIFYIKLSLSNLHGLHITITLKKCCCFVGGIGCFFGKVYQLKIAVTLNDHCQFFSHFDCFRATPLG